MSARAPSVGARHPGHASEVSARYRAVRIPLSGGEPLDPFALAGATGVALSDGGRVLVGLGRALVLDLPGGIADGAGVDATVASLATIACDDRLDGGRSGARHPVVAFGALPFDREAPAELVVPELTYCREADGTEWVTAVDAGGSPLPDPDDPFVARSLRSLLAARAASAVTDGPGPRAAARTAPAITPLTDDHAFERAVGAAVDAVRRGEVVKVVLARAVDVRLDGEVDVPELLRRWRALEPSCTVFSVATPDGQFVGASPELLVERESDHVRSRPLAGTTDRFHDSGSELPAALLDSAKDGEEHRLVVDALRSGLTPVSDLLHVPHRPELVHLHTITHLGTSIDGTLRHGPDGSLPSALHLVARLHPTPAVCGVPRAAATELIRALEPVPRGTYAGPVGWVDGAGDGRWMVGIRALTVHGPTVRMTAGVGIVAGSDPRTELVEADLKFRAVFGALAPGAVFRTATSG